MPEPLQELEQITADSVASIKAAESAQSLESQRVAWLGRKSRLVSLMKLLGTLPPEQRPLFGKRVNEVRRCIEDALDQRKAALAQTRRKSTLDVSLPGSLGVSGSLHPVTQTMHEVVSLFVRMGFEVADGPEIEYEYYNFDALNIPREHPSRDAMDTFFVNCKSDDPEKGKLLLRTHTSPVQIRVMEKQSAPVKIVVPGRVYRRDAIDATHSYMFHQVEGLLVGPDVSFADLKGILDQFLKQLFGDRTKTRFRPHFFPFTEPSAEVDISADFDSKEAGAALSKRNWLEIMGCGMVHPNVLRGVGCDPNTVQGFAFGMGVERIAMLKHGITDIRMFYENDMRFLAQFGGQ